MDESIAPTEPSLSIAAYRARTPARVLAGRSGAAYRTDTHLCLRGDHASARDAVQAEIDLQRDLGSDLIEQFKVFLVQTEARDRTQYLRRPDLGRKLSAPARTEITRFCPRGVDLQVAIGDGLSTSAVAAQVPSLLPRLFEGANRRGLKVGQPFAIRYCRVGILNDIGDLLDPAVVILLIGERPGLATAESLSAYMAYRPRSGHTDAQRNLISNIHARGIRHDEAAQRILDLAEQMMKRKTSGVELKESLAWPQLPG